LLQLSGIIPQVAETGAARHFDGSRGLEESDMQSVFAARALARKR